MNKYQLAKEMNMIALSDKQEGSVAFSNKPDETIRLWTMSVYTTSVKQKSKKRRRNKERR